MSLKSPPHSLRDLANHYNAHEPIDVDDFQRRARLLQSMWREDQGYDAATYRDKLRGNRLTMPFALDSLANYLDDTIREVVRAEVLDDEKSSGKLYGTPRIFNNLLSSQPLCFNLFGHLQQDLELASKVFRSLTDGRIHTVETIEFEYSPGRGSERYTGDRSAFDVFALTRTAEGRRGFVGIEVKYHENLKGSQRELSPRHQELLRAINCFTDDALESLAAPELEQILRDHLLAGSMLEADDFDDGFFVFLSPDDNQFCQNALRQYHSLLTNTDTFQPWSMESVVDAIDEHTDAKWIDLFRERYLDFERIDEALGELDVEIEI